MSVDEVLVLMIPADSQKDPQQGRQKGTAATTTPMSGQVHEVPGDLVETLAECWTRCRMAGLQRAKGERWGRATGTVSTVVTAAAGTTLWSALQSGTSLATGWVVTFVGAVVAMAVALERFVTKGYQDDAKVMDGIVQTFHEVHVDLLAVASTCRLTGVPPSSDVMATAKKAVKDHVAAMSYERPTYDRARASVEKDLRALGFYR